MILLSKIGATAAQAARLFGDKLMNALDPELEYKVSAVPTKLNEFGFDRFGLSPEFLKYISLPGIAVYKHYFRVRTYGIENLPEGRMLVIANHSGQLPFDGAMLFMAALLEAKPPRILRGMAERFFPNIPFVAIALPRTGQVLGTPTNCARALDAGEAIMVFPEGVRGINKTYDKRYELQEFGHGFMRLALETKTPIVPVAIIGAEEQAPSVFDFKSLGKIFGFPALPIVPYPPFLPIIPLPVKYRIHFGEKMLFEGDPHDDEAVAVNVRTVRNMVQTMIRIGLKERKHVFW